MQTVNEFKKKLPKIWKHISITKDRNIILVFFKYKYFYYKKSISECIWNIPAKSAVSGRERNENDLALTTTTKKSYEKFPHRTRAYIVRLVLCNIRNKAHNKTCMEKNEKMYIVQSTHTHTHKPS